MRSGTSSGTVTSKSSAREPPQKSDCGIFASMRSSEPLRVAVSVIFGSMSRSDAHAFPFARTSAMPRAPVTRSSPARPMMTTRVTPAAGADALRGALYSQSFPKRPAVAVAAARERAVEINIRMTPITRLRRRS